MTQTGSPNFCPVAMASKMLEPRWTLLVLSEMGGRHPFQRNPAWRAGHVAGPALQAAGVRVLRDGGGAWQHVGPRLRIVEGGVDDIVAALEKGVTIVTPISPGGWNADFLDPDGFGLGLGLYQSGEKPRSLRT